MTLAPDVVLWPDDSEPDGWGDWVDVRPLLVDLDTLDEVEVARRVSVLVSQISEEAWCAGWLAGVGASSRRWAAEGLPADPYLRAAVDGATLDALRRARVRLGERWVAYGPEGATLTTVGSALWAREARDDG